MYWSIGNQNSAWDLINIKLYYLHFFFGVIMIDRRWIGCCFYYHVDWSNGSSIVWWLFENRDFVWQKLNLPSIVEVNLLLVTCKMVDRLILSMWDYFLRWYKTIGCWKVSKTIKDYNLCTKLSVSEIGVRQNKIN